MIKLCYGDMELRSVPYVSLLSYDIESLSYGVSLTSVSKKTRVHVPAECMTAAA